MGTAFMQMSSKNCFSDPSKDIYPTWNSFIKSSIKRF